MSCSWNGVACLSVHRNYLTEYFEDFEDIERNGL